MLTRLTATASAVFLGAALAVALPAGTARADCVVINNVVSCEASNASHKPGSVKKGRHGRGRGGLGAGCADQGNGVPQAICPINPPPAVQRIPAADLAAQARDAIAPPAPQINWSPKPRTYVQLRTGLWIRQRDFRQVDLTLPPVGGETVTAHAKPQSVTWNLVENTIVCQNAGSADGTACGYTYQRSSAGQPGGKYHITATITWGVTWNCAGPCDQATGALPDITTMSAADIPVDEIQTESQPG